MSVRMSYEEALSLMGDQTSGELRRFLEAYGPFADDLDTKVLRYVRAASVVLKFRSRGQRVNAS